MNPEIIAAVVQVFGWMALETYLYMLLQDDQSKERYLCLFAAVITLVGSLVISPPQLEHLLQEVVNTVIHLMQATVIMGVVVLLERKLEEWNNDLP